MTPYESEGLTPGELLAYVKANTERERRAAQTQAVLAYNHASLVAASAFGNDPKAEIYEIFPFWTDDEVREMRVQKIKRIMERHVAASKRS